MLRRDSESMTRKNPFKVGDRVRAFNGGSIADGEVTCISHEWMDILIQNETVVTVHFRQCVRLVKKGERKRCTIAWARVDIGEGTRFVYCLTHRRDAEVCKEKGLME